MCLWLVLRLRLAERYFINLGAFPGGRIIWDLLKRENFPIQLFNSNPHKLDKIHIFPPGLMESSVFLAGWSVSSRSHDNCTKPWSNLLMIFSTPSSILPTKMMTPALRVNRMGWELLDKLEVELRPKEDTNSTITLGVNLSLTSSKLIDLMKPVGRGLYEYKTTLSWLSCVTLFKTEVGPKAPMSSP